MANMDYYKKFKEVPAEAQKTIQAGKLKGFTDINPMWRIKMLTETFGACGLGWYTDDVKMWVENSAGESAVFVTLNLYIKEKAEWSKPIFGIGGSKLSGKGVGDGINDEAYKMAYTDALSIACKNLGMGADIYFAKDKTKYESAVPEKPQAYKPLSNEMYWKVVENYAKGTPTKKGGDYRSEWIAMTHPDFEAICKFDNDVDNYKAYNNI